MYSKIRKILLSMVGIGLLLTAGFLSLVWYVTKVPYSAPGIVSTEHYLEIPSGSSAYRVGQLLEEDKLIRSSDLFVATLRTLGKENSIKSGKYYFNKPLTLEQIIGRITTARYELPTNTITLFEGEANYEYAERLARQFEYINNEEFIRLAREHEGYLFPDTYSFPMQSTAQEVIDIMLKNYEKKVGPVRDAYQGTHDWEEIMIMASIIETEANGSYEIKQAVSGVLWRRIDIGMLLQADAVFAYIYQKHLPRVLYKHLEVDSPYNVYKNTGLPPGPISNPGLDSIHAAIDPVNPQGYLYYLTGNDGKFYYAKTLSAHEQNRRRYLK